MLSVVVIKKMRSLGDSVPIGSLIGSLQPIVVHRGLLGPIALVCTSTRVLEYSRTAGCTTRVYKSAILKNNAVARMHLAGFSGGSGALGSWACLSV